MKTTCNISAYQECTCQPLLFHIFASKTFTRRLQKLWFIRISNVCVITDRCWGLHLKHCRRTTSAVTLNPKTKPSYQHFTFPWETRVVLPSDKTHLSFSITRVVLNTSNMYFSKHFHARRSTVTLISSELRPCSQ